MSGKRVRSLLAGAALCSIVLPASAETRSETEALRAELESLRAEVSQLRQSESDQWLNERRAEEVKSLIRDVLADAETRSTLLQDGLTAGHDGKQFFLQSADGAYRLNVGGQIQVRALWDFQDDRGDTIEDTNADGDEIERDVTDEDDYGLQIRRTKLWFHGHIGSPKLTYYIQLATDRGDGDVLVEDVIVGHTFDNGITLQAGKWKLPFLAEELLSSKRQLAIERAMVTEFFTLDRGEQIMVSYEADMWRTMLSFNDGADEEFSTIGEDAVELAFTGRGEVLLMGEWGQGKDYVAWDGEDTLLVLGGAGHYQMGDGNNADNGSESQADYAAWTVDALFETAGWSLNGAFTGGHIMNSSVIEDRDMFGALLQGGYNINDTYQPFVRWEWIDGDVDDEGDIQALTVGVNYFIKKHNAKLSADVVWVYDHQDFSNPFGNSITSDGLGISGLDSDGDDLVVLRGQFQLVF